MAFGISHRQGDQAGFRFQPAPVLGIPLSVGRIRRHGVLCPSHPGVERLSQVYVPIKGPASGRFCEGSSAPVESCRASGPLALLRQRRGVADTPSSTGQAKTKLDPFLSAVCACSGAREFANDQVPRQANRTSGNCIGFQGLNKPRTFEATTRNLMVHAETLHSLSLALEPRELKREIASRMLEISSGPGPAAANAMTKSISGYCSWLVGAGLLETNPAASVIKATEIGARAHVIGFPGWKEEPGELGAIWRAVADVDDEQSAIVRLLIMLWMRRTEVGDLRWSEVNRDCTQIKMSWERTKQRKQATKKYDFVVPLPALASELLRSLPRRPGRDLIFGRGDGDRGFQGWDKLKQAIDARIQPAIRPWRLHDIRRCASTAAAELDMAPPHIREAALGHTVGGIAGIYCKAEFFVARRALLTNWCTFVQAAAAGEQPELTTNVVKLQSA